MRVLIETGHPGQVHQFRHLATELKQAGHRVLFVAKEKEMTRYLLQSYEMDYRFLSKSSKGPLQKILQLPIVYMRYICVIIQYQPQLIISRFSLQSSHLAWLFSIPHIGYSDTEHVKKLDALTVPFVGTRISSHTYGRQWGKNHFRFRGNTELFYLHPLRFKANPEVRTMLGVGPNEPYAILRFVAWKAHHDIGKYGLSAELKEYIVNMLSEKMKVFISSEDPLSPALKPYRFTLPPEMMHDALAFSSLYLGEGGTMASEAAMLGVPAIYVNPLTVGYVEDEAKAGLVISLRNGAGVPEALQKWLDDGDAITQHQILWKKYIADMVDPTEYFFRLIDDYPQSIAALKKGWDITKRKRTDQNLQDEV